MNSLILATASRIMLPLLLFFAVFLLFRGHHLPGGGFSAGLVASSAYVLFGVAYGREAALMRLRIAPVRLIGVGLCVVLAAGSLSALDGLPFFTGLWVYVDTPIAQMHLGTPLLFDVGVFMTVAGMALSILLSLLET